mmetsp:Transcript_815/g.2522  ORF Transcript_815/g.2522 Transcript_815/m.2522 type:complete len:404 (+) Transcript_815:487-1698(+)
MHSSGGCMVGVTKVPSSPSCGDRILAATPRTCSATLRWRPRSRRTRLPCPSAWARSMAVAPSTATAAESAPCSSRAFTAASQPACAAWCRAVWPRWSAASTSTCRPLPVLPWLARLPPLGALPRVPPLGMVARGPPPCKLPLPVRREVREVRREGVPPEGVRARAVVPCRRRPTQAPCPAAQASIRGVVPSARCAFRSALSASTCDHAPRCAAMCSGVAREPPSCACRREELLRRSRATCVASMASPSGAHAAACRAVMPSSPQVSRVCAPAASSCSTTPAAPACAASISACTTSSLPPSPLLGPPPAPDPLMAPAGLLNWEDRAASSRATAESWPPCAASSSGLSGPPMEASAGQPAASSTATTSEWPAAAAASMGTAVGTSPCVDPLVSCSMMPTTLACPW